MAKKISHPIFKIVSCKCVRQNLSDGLPLGMIPETSYPERELILQADDVIIFYTDGLIEAENEAEELYGIERLKQSVTHSAMSVSQIIETILRDVTDFAGTQYDDMTVVVVKRSSLAP